MKQTIAILVMLMLIVTGCSSNDALTGKTAEGSDLPIKIGWIGGLTGTGAVYGTIALNAAQLAVEDINNDGGINGRKIELVAEDGKCEGATSATAASKLLEIDGVKYILGGHCSTESLSILPIAEQKGAFILAGATSSDKFPGTNKKAFRTTTPTPQVMAEEARLAYANGARTASILYEQKDYPEGNARYIQEYFTDLGGKVISYEAFQPGTNDFSTQLLKIKQLDADAVFLFVQGPDTAATLVKQIAEIGLKQRIYSDLMVVSAATYEKTGSKLPSDAYSVSVHADVENNPHTKGFMDRSVSKYGPAPMDPIFATESYDSVKIVAELVKYCGDDTDCARVRMTSKEWDGVTGMFKFGEDGNPNMHIAKIHVENGKVVAEAIGEVGDLSSSGKVKTAPVKIGVIVPLTGDLAEYGIAFRNGLTLAEEETGCGKGFEYILEDNKYDPKNAVTAFYDLKDVKNVSMIVNWGAYPSSAVAPLAKDTGFPLIAVTTTLAPEVRGPNTIRGMGDPDKLASALMSYLRSKGVKKIGFVEVQNPFLDKMISSMKEQKNPDETLTTIDTVQPTDMDFKNSIIKAEHSGEQAIGVFLFSGQIRQFYKQRAQLGLEIPTFGTDFFESQPEIDGSEGTMDGAVYPTWHTETGFAQRYEARFADGNQIAYAAGAYDLCGIISKADFTTKDTIIPSIERLKDHTGVEGTINALDKDGDRFLDVPIDLKIIQNSTIKVIG